MNKKNRDIVYEKIKNSNKGLTVNELCELVILPEGKTNQGIYHRILPICIKMEKEGILTSVLDGRQKRFSVKIID
jgi:hypothetical protein